MQITQEQFDSMIQELQQKSLDEAREAFGEKGFDRWRTPRFNLPLINPDCSARLKGNCGDTVEIFLKFRDNRVDQASYTTDGCGSSALCGSFTAELAHGKDPEELLDLEPADVLRAIGTFPQEDEHCATLAILVLHEAVNNFMIDQSKTEGEDYR